MIHLLGKVYLEYAETKPQINHLSAKPEQYVRLIDRGLGGIVDRDTMDSNLCDFLSLEAAIENFATLDNFLSFLLAKTQQDRVLVYCDEISMPKLLCSLWKSLFPNIDLDTAYSFYVSYKDTEHFKNEFGREYINIEVDSSKLNKEDFLPRYWNLNKEAFKTIFETAPTFSLEGHEELMGLEFMFTKLLLDKKKHNQAFSKKLEHLYRKNLVKEVLTMVSMIKEHALVLLNRKGAKDKVVLNDKSVVDFLKNDSKYAIIFDREVIHSADSYLYLKTKYNLLKVITDLYADCSLIHASTNPSFVSIKELEQEYPICMHILAQKKEPSLKEFMSDDVVSFENYHFFKNFINTGIMNYFLLQSVHLAHKEDPKLLDALR